MTYVPAAAVRRPVLLDPDRRPGYDALVRESHRLDLGTAIRAARRSCVLTPGSRRLRKNLLNLLIAAERWSEVPAAVPRRRIARQAPGRHPVDLTAALRRYAWLLEQQRRRAAEGWVPSRVEDVERRLSMTPEQLPAFRRPGPAPDVENHLLRHYAGFLNRLYQIDSPDIDRYDAAARDDGRFGARPVDLPGVGAATADSLQAAYFACRIRSLVPANGVVLEIGSGFGALASRLMAIRPDVTCIVTDLPANLVRTHVYLTSLYGDAVAGLWEDGEVPAAGQRALVVPPWRLAGLPLRVDLAVDATGFRHMDERNHAFYGETLRRLGTRRLFHVDREARPGRPDADTRIVPTSRHGILRNFEVRQSDTFAGEWVEVVAEARRPPPPVTAIRRALVASPADGRALQALLPAEEKRDPDAAIRAARRHCMIDPDRRVTWHNLQFLLRSNRRWDDLHDAIPRRANKLPPMHRLPVDLDAAVARYGRLMDQMDRRSGEGWTPSRIEGGKRRFPLDRDHLARFRRSEVSSGTQTFPDRPNEFPALDFGRFYPDLSPQERARVVPTLQGQYLGLLCRLYRCGSPGIDWYDAAARDDARFDPRTAELPRLGTVTAKSLQAAYYACRIVSLVPRNGTVLEIGGGFGMLASRLLAIRPDVTYVLTDLPVNMVLTHTYLASLYGDAVAGLWEDGDRPGPGQRALVVPPWRLAELPLQVDLAVNTMSFQHMDERNHAFYGDALRRLGTRRLYHLNREVPIAGWDTMDIPASQYGFMADYSVVETDDFDQKWVEVIAEARG
ncbi:putative sugar O-methyltransferase [Thalassobaculum fulvum]|uniref:putative sugar O-methyltransferase n=1 Tax=Thalassobaculum fulvum TaxID=1633335 RepID=UPI001673E203|nr:putative sugar O-methyltransferase [Thalassobaculum fulvum]